MRYNKKNNFAEGGTELKILTWNIYMLLHCNLLKGNCRRARIIADKLYGPGYNIIVFEEAFDYKARNIIKQRLESKFPFIYGPANDSFFSFKTSSGIWALSAIPLQKLKEIEYNKFFGIDAFARKGAVMFDGMWKENEFQLIGTHLQADSPDEIRREQCRQIAGSLLQHYAKPDVPQIVCGDFNIEMSDTVNYNYMLYTLDAENGKMEGDLNVSYDEQDNSLAWKENGKKQLIDYVLVHNSNLISYIRRKVSVFREYMDNKIIELSDHYAIEATIGFVPKAEYSASLN